MENILFITSAHKGDPMVRAVKSAGYRVMMITEEELRNDPWPYDSIDEIFFVPKLLHYQDVINAVSYLCRSHDIRLILPLDEFEVELVAILREHLRLPGTVVSTVRNFRDKLAMRQKTRAAGMAVPDFIQILNYDRLNEFMAKVPAPWVFKPRMEAGSMGVQKVHNADEVWQKVHALGDKQSYYLLEQFVAGDVFHVDSLTVNGKVAFAAAHKYGKPPMQVYQGGGVFTTRSVSRDDPDLAQLETHNAAILKTLGMENGAAHAEFIKSHADGKFYFLEVAARVGGANIGDMVELATGINLWRAWGNLEVALLRGEKYKLPKASPKYAGMVQSLSKQEHPDMTGYTDKELVWRLDKPFHAGAILVSADHKRVETLLDDYSTRFVQDFLAVGTPMGVTRTGHAG
jgi:biotin carboxylase